MGLFPSFRNWFLLNNDTFQLVKGQFEAQNVSESRGSAYVERFTLNRNRGVLQFLHGQSPLLSFQGRVFNETILGPIPTFGSSGKIVDLLKKWSERDPDLGRPPLLTFWIGDGQVGMPTCVLESISPINYDQPAFLGAFKGATFTLNLRWYEVFDLKATTNFDTRYARAKLGEYYELLAWQEYKNPMLGVTIRQRHPWQINLTPGQIVKLPSKEGMRRVRPQPTSIVFKDAFAQKPTATRGLQIYMFKRRNKAQVSHVLTSG